jgi:ubiquitin-protein ligase
MANNMSLKYRRLQDIAELQTKPYPNITLHVQDSDATKACLILTAERYGPMHLTVEFPHNYPLSPPQVRMDSGITHPNIFGDYICASILNTTEGYTSAYTLKGVAIQLLSFFSSDTIEQSGGYYSVNLDEYQGRRSNPVKAHVCRLCQFGLRPRPTATKAPSRSGNSPQSRALAGTPRKGIQRMNVPDEILLAICENLDAEDLWVFAEAWDRIGHVITEFDVIRTRELQCFCLKKDYIEVKLGVGVAVIQRGRIGSFESEFDLLSHQGFYEHGIRSSVHGVPFEHWLPLPISNGHWRKVKGDVKSLLSGLAEIANLGRVEPVWVIYNFMNDIVVKLNQKASQPGTSSYSRFSNSSKSTLTHASEKAIESYFHLFHLLLCLAAEDSSIVQEADKLLRDFASGQTSKQACPNLGHLLVASLISPLDMTDGIRKAIVKEAITRNVVWMLDAKGSNMPELSYMEPSAVSEYRLAKTFEASQTSYRLLMFLNLFRTVAVGNPRKPLTQLRDEAFARHGAPPRGSAKGLADSIKRIHQVSNFPDFLLAMGIGKPGAAWFTNFLRECVQDSIAKGYSKMPITQSQALYLRLMKEPHVEVKQGVQDAHVDPSRLSFFPGNNGGGNHGGRRAGGRRR